MKWLKFLRHKNIFLSHWKIKLDKSIIIIYMREQEREGGKKGEGNEEEKREKEEKEGGERVSFAFKITS